MPLASYPLTLPAAPEASARTFCPPPTGVRLILLLLLSCSEVSWNLLCPGKGGLPGGLGRNRISGSQMQLLTKKEWEYYSYWRNVNEGIKVLIMQFQQTYQGNFILTCDTGSKVYIEKCLYEGKQKNPCEIQVKGLSLLGSKIHDKIISIKTVHY